MIYNATPLYVVTLWVQWEFTFILYQKFMMGTSRIVHFLATSLPCTCIVPTPTMLPTTHLVFQDESQPHPKMSQNELYLSLKIPL